MIDGSRITFTEADAELQPGHLRVRDVTALRWWKERPTASRFQLDAFPTFDEMVTLYLAQLAEKGLVPPQLEALCLYAEDVRQGRWVDRVAPELALQAVYLALAQAEAKAQPRFLEETGTLFDYVTARLVAGDSLVATPMLALEPRFQKYIAALVDDQRLYREDLERSQQWRVSFPPRSVKLLVLDRPASREFKLWARRSDDFALMLVRLPDGSLVLSSDPSSKLRVDAFAAELSRLDLHPWYAGERHQGTLIASSREGTRLTFADVRRVLKARVPTPRLALLVPIGVAVLIALLAAWRPMKPVTLGAKGDPLEPQQVISLLQSAEGPGSFESYALVAGVCGYRDEHALSAPCDDARAVRDLLVTKLGYPRDHVLFFIDRPNDGERVDGVPDAVSLKLAVERFRTRFPAASAQSSFFFYYSGHGGYEKGARKDFGVLQPAGYFEQPDAPMQTRGWDMQELVDDLRKGVPSRHVMIALDACYSGWAVGAKGDALLSPELRSLWAERAEVVLSAGTKGQRAWEDDAEAPRWGGHSAFTAFLLEGMTKGDVNGDHVVTDEELAAWLRQKVPPAVKEAKRADQVPQFFRFDEALPKSGQFLFVAR